jgi:hypothetical protein
MPPETATNFVTDMWEISNGPWEVSGAMFGA